MTDYNELMIRAYQVAKFSPDPSTQNGGVLISATGHDISTGCNDFPTGIDRGYWHGEKQNKYDRVVHAEVACLLNAARSGRSTLGSTLVCGWASCANCAKHMAYAGVKTLVRHTYSNNGADTGSHWYQDCIVGDDILKEAGVEIVEIDPVPCDIQLRRNGALWTPSVISAAATNS